MAVAEPLVFAPPSARPTNIFGDYHASIVAHSRKKSNSLELLKQEEKMPIPPIHKMLPPPQLGEWLEYSKHLISTVDETIEFTPISPSASLTQKALRILFMNARTASYEICILADSLLNNNDHHVSRGIEYSIRLLWETAIDYFYISMTGDSTAQRYLEFLDIANTLDSDERENKHTAFKQKYPNTDRGDYWSGVSREEKSDKGIMSNSSYNKGGSITDLIKPTFKYLNEHVHGNFVFGSYWSFNKHGKQYLFQIGSGLLNLLFFYALSHDYCISNGRGSEVARFRFYASYILEHLGESFTSTETGIANQC